MEAHSLLAAVFWVCYYYLGNVAGKPLLWARYDRKPNKAGDKKFQRYKAQLSLWKQSGEIGEQPQHKWDLGKDFKVHLLFPFFGCQCQFLIS